MFTKSIAVDLIADNIRVNCLCPGITQTPLLDQEVATSADPEATRAEFAKWAPIGRTADPTEQARGILFLASDESSFAVGSTLLLDGGFTEDRGHLRERRNRDPDLSGGGMRYPKVRSH